MVFFLYLCLMESIPIESTFRIKIDFLSRTRSSRRLTHDLVDSCRRVDTLICVLRIISNHRWWPLQFVFAPYTHWDQNALLINLSIVSFQPICIAQKSLTIPLRPKRHLNNAGQVTSPTISPSFSGHLNPDILSMQSSRYFNSSWSSKLGR